MPRGRITRLVTSAGSNWGLIRPSGDLRELFFNDRSVARSGDFGQLRHGQAVDFQEEADAVNGARAVSITIVPLQSLAGRRS
jgi:cold shock CspA family protein